MSGVLAAWFSHDTPFDWKQMSFGVFRRSVAGRADCCATGGDQGHVTIKRSTSVAEEYEEDNDSYTEG